MNRVFPGRSMYIGMPRRLAAHPGVRAKIREFQELFSTEDAEAIQHHASCRFAYHLSIDCE